jgi:xanthine dehydrogenase accessory factor
MVDEPGEILKVAIRWLDEGRRICLATVVKRTGSAPREVGAKMVITADGRSAGSIGGGRAEQAVLERMRLALGDGKPAVIDLDLSEKAEDLDALCGGAISVFVEPIGEARRLVVIGAGHVGVALGVLARDSGFAVTLVDDRQEYLDAPLPGSGIERLRAEPDQYESLRVNKDTFVVICTRGHQLDKEWLGNIIGLKPRYLGMLGSKHKAESVFGRLEHEGIPRDLLDRVRTPVGIDIGALTPTEIAVSIVAELISEWRKADRGKTS